MSFVDSWVETDPDGSVITGSQLDDYQRQSKRALRERLEGDAADPLTGIFEIGSFALAPMPKAGSGRIYSGTDAAIQATAAASRQNGRMGFATDTNRLYHVGAAAVVEIGYMSTTGPNTQTAAASRNASFMVRDSAATALANNVLFSTNGVQIIAQAHNTSARIATVSYAGASQIIGYRANGTSAAPTQAVNGSTLASFQGRGYTSAPAWTNDFSAAMEIVATESWTATANGSKIAFLVTPNGSVLQATALTIGQDSGVTFAGAITYGGTTLTAGVTGTGSMVLSASPTFTGAVTTNGAFVTTGSTGAALGSVYYSASDGMAVRGKGGSLYDFSYVGVAGGYIIRNPTGTSNIEIPNGSFTAGVVTISAAGAVSGITTLVGTGAVSGFTRLSLVGGASLPLLTLGASNFGNPVAANTVLGTETTVSFYKATNQALTMGLSGSAQMWISVAGSSASGFAIYTMGDSTSVPTKALDITAAGNVTISKGTLSAGNGLAMGNSAITGVSSIAFGTTNNNTMLNGTGMNVTTGYVYLVDMANTGGKMNAGLEGSAGGQISTGSTAYAFVMSSFATPLEFGTNNTVRISINSSGVIDLKSNPIAGTIYTVRNSQSASVTTGDIVLPGANAYRFAHPTTGTNATYSYARVASSIVTFGNTSWDTTIEASSLITLSAAVTATGAVTGASFGSTSGNVNHTGGVNQTIFTMANDGDTCFVEVMSRSGSNHHALYKCWNISGTCYAELIYSTGVTVVVSGTNIQIASASSIFYYWNRLNLKSF